MNLPYQFTPYMLPMFATAAFSTVLAMYGWRRRFVHGAAPFAILMALDVMWAMGAVLVLAAVDVPTKIFWWKFEFFWQGPVVVAGLCFVLDYCRLNRFLTRRNLILLLLFPLFGSFLILTNDAFHLLWLDFTFDGVVHPVSGSANTLLVITGLAITLLNFPALIGLFIRSPQHRLPVALILSGQLAVRIAFMLQTANINPFAPMDFTVLVMNYSSLIYVIALFGFRIFDPIPMARRTVIEQMQEGMIVLDTQQHIVDLNPTAERILGVGGSRAKGRKLNQVLMAQTNSPEITIGTGAAARYYAMRTSPLTDSWGAQLGQMILLQDMTEQKRAQAQLLEQQRALATMEERERLARELHDNLGQVISFVNVQAQTVREVLSTGDIHTADDYVARLVQVAQDSDADIRESILGLRVASVLEQGFVAALDQYLRQFHKHYDLQTELVAPRELAPHVFEPLVEIQLLRIVQEALANARKHARASRVKVCLTFQEHRAQIVIEDDGQGFDLATISTAERQKFGLGFMRERAEQIGAELVIDSAPGKGTRVVIKCQSSE